MFALLCGSSLADAQLIGGEFDQLSCYRISDPLQLRRLGVAEGRPAMTLRHYSFDQPDNVNDPANVFAQDCAFTKAVLLCAKSVKRTCAGGTRDLQFCQSDADCPEGTCADGDDPFGGAVSKGFLCYRVSCDAQLPATTGAEDDLGRRDVKGIKLLKLKYACQPVETFADSCGNGVLESGEECDPGPPFAPGPTCQEEGDCGRDCKCTKFKCLGQAALPIGTNGNDGSQCVSGLCEVGAAPCTTSCDCPGALVGTAGADVIQGRGGDDVVCGLGGDDIICGGAGNDIVLGGDDNDTLSGESGDDDIAGEAGDDTLLGGDGNDTLNGDSGLDTINGDAGGDTILGGDGNDILAGDIDDDIIFGGPDDDLITGGPGADTLTGDNGDDDVSGDDGADTLTGGAGNDTLSGGAANDNIKGEGGNDAVCGGDGVDFLFGDSGDDTLCAEDCDLSLPLTPTCVCVDDGAADAILGGDDSDQLFGCDGNDVLLGENGADVLVGGNGTADSCDGGNDTDSCDCESNPQCE